MKALAALLLVLLAAPQDQQPPTVDGKPRRIASATADLVAPGTVTVPMKAAEPIASPRAWTRSISSAGTSKVRRENSARVSQWRKYIDNQR